MSNHHRNHGRGGDHCCGSIGVSSSVQQSMAEMEFERGIWSAACDGEMDKVEKFLRHGTRADCRDSSGLTALHYAARNGHIDVCRSLLRNSATVDLTTRAGGSTALQRAAYRGQTEVVRLLINCGANLSLQDSDGQTVLHKAAEGKREEVVAILLENNRDLLTIKDNRGRLPIDCVPANNELMSSLLSPT